MKVEYRVIYGDTDTGGVMYYANYLRLFEIGRTELLRRQGLTYRDLEEQRGLILPVAEAHIRYRAPARYDDLLEIHTRISEVRPHRVRFDYRILRQGRLLAEGYTVHAPVSREGRLQKFPPDILEFLQTLSQENPSAG
ncbi:thioesterase family protein [Thermosulfurimonas sp.]|uniref:acyl-CoA thioesterase n=1 Tax=Thermosulfurimonas sp. TaxID=2080236 RepID=UPI0025EA9147|nr:thioesterase family protein [Thermosulfurimonas sp.]